MTDGPSDMSFTFMHSALNEPPISIPQLGLSLQVRIPPASTGGAITCIETINAPRFGPPLHRHQETEIFRVLAGQYLFEVDGRRFVASSGDVVVAPGGAAHAFRNITDAPARQFIMIMPGIDAAAFFLGLGAIMRDGMPDRATLNSFGEIWRMEFLGPPLSDDSVHV